MDEALRDALVKALRSAPFESTAGYQDRFRHAGDLRAAAFALSDALRGTGWGDLAAEVHDSMCCFLPGKPDLSAREVRERLGEEHPGKVFSAAMEAADRGGEDS